MPSPADIAPVTSRADSPAGPLAPLIKAGAITRSQADSICAAWPHLDADAFSHPHLRNVPEHTRLYLEATAAR
jgi:hypothetical protein